VCSPAAQLDPLVVGRGGGRMGEGGGGLPPSCAGTGERHTVAGQVAQARELDRVSAVRGGWGATEGRDCGVCAGPYT